MFLLWLVLGPGGPGKAHGGHWGPSPLGAPEPPGLVPKNIKTHICCRVGPENGHETPLDLVYGADFRRILQHLSSLTRWSGFRGHVRSEARQKRPKPRLQCSSIFRNQYFSQGPFQRPCPYWRFCMSLGSSGLVRDLRSKANRSTRPHSLQPHP
jgi:hypothetical protein